MYHDGINIVAQESNQPFCSELKRQLPRMAEMLGESPDNVHVLDYSWFPQEYMNTPFRDHIVAKAGVLEGLPNIEKRALQAPGRVGYGIYIFENRLDPNIKYALFCARGQQWDETYLVVAKGKLFRLKRNALQLNKLCNQELHPPILRDGLLDEIVRNTVGFLMMAKEIEKYGVKIKRGVILDGPPGNGKTMVCRYIQKLCSQNSIDWGVITSADIDEAYHDKELNQLFVRYTVTFFDDIDVGYMDRNKGQGKMACSLLTAMDGMHEGGHLVRIFTTNESTKDLDKAFTRPGRIDRLITLDKPDASLRRRLLETWPQEILDAIDVDDCVRSSNDFSFAELEAIRTFLVTNRLLGDGTWNLDAAFAEFDERRAENKKLGVGFGGLDHLRSTAKFQSPAPAAAITPNFTSKT